MFLDQKWFGTGGFTWWEQKLRDVCQVIARYGDQGDHLKAFAFLAKRAATLVWVPYHSRAYQESLKNLVKGCYHELRERSSVKAV